MFGLYLNSAATLDAELAQTVAGAGIPSPGEVVGHAYDTAPAGAPTANREVGSALDRPALAAWRAAAVSPSFRMVGAEWSKSILAAAMHGTEEGGQVHVRAAQRHSPALLTTDRLVDWVGPRAAEGPDGWMVLPARSDVQPPRSLLWWYLSNDGHLVLQEARLRARAAGREEHLRAIVDGGTQPPPMAPNWNAANLANISHSHRYWFTGIGYKAGILGHIISDLRGGSDLRLLDIGSGPGWVPLELLLDPASPIANATALDRRLDYGAVGVTVARELELGADRFRFSDAGASGHSWEEPQDVVTALGSLLYLPREESTSVLDRAWDCLRSGGLLIVHENIRQDAFKGRSNDYDIMFTTEEIDALLGRFGPVRRFASSGPTEVARDKAGQRAVFRVVQKP